MIEDVGKKISDFGQHMMKKTGEVAEIASLSTKVMIKKKKIQEELKNLGKAYYEAHKDEISEFETNITRINDLFVEIDTLEEEIKILKEKLPEGMESEEPEKEEPAEEPEEKPEEPAAEEPVEETLEEDIEEMKEAADEAVEEVKDTASDTDKDSEEE